MTLEQAITHATTRAAVARSNGDETAGDYWWAEAERLLDQRDREAEHANA